MYFFCFFFSSRRRHTRYWRDWSSDVCSSDLHMTPEEAVRAHGDLGGQVLVPVHWATFNLAFHRWAEPVQRLVASAERTGVPVVVPMPGQRVDGLDPPPLEDWWSAVGSVDEEESRTGARVGSAMVAGVVAWRESRSSD